MLANATIADVLMPGEKRVAWLYDIALIFGGSLLIALCAKIKVFLPFSPVPITGQTFAVLMTGALLGSWRGSLAAILYILEGVGGLPVFAMGGGYAVLVGPTGGYIIGFVPAAYITGLLAQKGWDRQVATTILAMILGNLAIYALGLLWLCRLMGVNITVLTVGMYPFIVGDVLKIILAAIILPSGWRLLRYAGFDDRIKESAT